MFEYLENVPLLTLLSALPSALRRDMKAHSLGREELTQADTIVSQTLRQIREQLNLLSPTARLPSEILSQCFENVLSCDLPECGELERLLEARTKATKRIAPIHPLITITHVCRRWRDIALDTPKLWACIDDETPTLMEVFLARSQNTSISIRTTMNDVSRIALVLSKHGSRMKLLNLTVEDQLASFIPPLLQFEAPLLECLAICSKTNSPPSFEDFTTLLFRKRELNLRALALVGLNPWLPGNCFPQLTHLKLSKFADHFLVEDNIPHLRQLLLSTPALQYLHIGKFGYGISINNVGDTIPLPALRALTFTESMFLPTLLLFAMLDLPKDVVVRLDTLKCVSASRSVPQFPIPSRELLSSLDCLEIVNELEELHLIARGPMSGLWIQARCVEGRWDEWLSHLTTFLPMPSIKKLHVSFMDSEVFIHLLPQFPHLMELVVLPRQEVLAGMIHGLKYAIQIVYETLARTDPIPVPQLQVLKIKARRTFSLALVETFVAMAKARHALGYPLHTVIIDVDPNEENEQRSKAAFLAAEPYIVKCLDLNSRIGTSCFVVDERWEDPEAERWWTLPDNERARF